MNTSIHKNLFTPVLKARIAHMGKQNTYNPLVIAKFTNPCGVGTWFLTDYLSEEDRYIAYYMAAVPDEDEWVYVTETELGSLRFSPLQLPLKRDPNFTEIRFSELQRS